MACYKQSGTRRYFEKNSQLPVPFFPPKTMPHGSAIERLIHGEPLSGPLQIDGEIWCKDDALVRNATVYEHAFHYHEDEFITLVWWQDEEPIWQFIEAGDS